ncbi:MAG: histidine kinase [Acidobacteriia bacterium]|nr:histidine kinase [Terriglobia bacterium]
MTKRNFRTYALVFLAWTVVGLFFFSQGLTQKLFSRDPTPWWHYLVSWLVGVYTSAFLTPVILWLGRRFPIERRNWPRRVALHVLLSIAFSFVQLAWESAILPRIGVFPAFMKGFVGTFFVVFMLGFHGNITTYFTLLGIQYGFRYYRKYQEREREALRLELHASELQSQLAQAQLNALKMQLQPHFLFNTLNAIMVLVRQQKGRQAEEMLSRLSDLLRCVLEDVDAQEVPLRRELEYLKLYLSIEQVRFQDRLQVEISADAAILDAAVPHMGLQPIVENAIRHGIGRSSAAGKIQIKACRVNETLEVKVRDDGPGLPPVLQSRGIGLANTRARLQQLYGDAAHLAVENGETGGAVATMVLPYHMAPGISETEVMEVHALDHVDR